MSRSKQTGLQAVIRPKGERTANSRIRQLRK